jgi:hypothetical protein
VEIDQGDASDTLDRPSSFWSRTTWAHCLCAALQCRRSKACILVWSNCIWVVVIRARCREKQWTQAAAACWSSSPQRCPVDYSIPCYLLQIDCRCLIISCGSVHLQSSSSACLFLWQYLITPWRQEDLLQPAGV